MEIIPATTRFTVYDSGQASLGQDKFYSFFKDIEQGVIKPILGPLFDLDDIFVAHQLMESNTINGKIVVLPKG